MRRKLTEHEREQVYAKTHGHCAYCGTALLYAEMQVDHVRSLYGENGADEMGNLLPACRSCNHYKSTMTLEKFREQLERMPAVLRRDSVTYRIAERYGLLGPQKQRVAFYFEQMEEAE